MGVFLSGLLFLKPDLLIRRFVIIIIIICLIVMRFMLQMFTWQLSLGQYTTSGTGPNKKIARNTAAEQMMTSLPDQWKQVGV